MLAKAVGHEPASSRTETIMSKINSLQELYIDELKDLWSAQDQMARALRKISPRATDDKLAQLLQDAQDGITQHTGALKGLIQANGEELSKEHCKGMEGLAAEAIKHAVDNAPEQGPVLDAAIIAQFQRMTHYGITGFGTVAAFAKALDLSDDAETLSRAVADMRSGDDMMSRIAESAINGAAV